MYNKMLDYEFNNGTFVVKSGKEIFRNSYDIFETKIKKLVLNEGLVRVGASAFYSFDIENLILPSTLRVIETCAFAYNHFSRLILNDGLEEIGSYAFKGCNICELVIPSSVKEIGNGAFLKNDQLMQVFVYEDSPVCKFEQDQLMRIFGQKVKINIINSSESIVGILDYDDVDSLKEELMNIIFSNKRYLKVVLNMIDDNKELVSKLEKLLSLDKKAMGRGKRRKK